MKIVDINDDGVILTGMFIIFAAKRSNFAHVPFGNLLAASIASMASDSSRSRSSISIPWITIA
jgi:hypothetical protein